MTRPEPHVVPEEDGMYEGVIDLHYHRWRVLSRTALGDFDRSPAHYRQAQEAKDEEQTRSQKVGSAFHMATLQPDEFERWFVARPDGHPNSNAYKAKVQEIRAERPFVRILRQDDLDTVRRMADAVHEHPTAGALLTGRTPELSIVWTDEEHDVRCKARIDDVSDLGAIVDLKSCRDARPDPFGKQAWRYHYYRQVFYLRGARQLGMDVTDLAFVACEKRPPFGIMVHEVPPDLLDLAEMEISDLMTRFAWCEKTGEWPGYDGDVHKLTLPSWGMRELERYAEEGAQT